MSSRLIPLREACEHVLVVAHDEDTSRLEAALRADGFAVSIVRGPYTERQLQWSASCRCLVNHANAWRQIERIGKPTIVVEADFVPVRNFGFSSIPRSWLAGASSGFAWLYSAGSVLYGMDEDGAPFGHGNTMVAYVVAPQAAPALMRFFEHEVARNPDGKYSRWDSMIGPYLRWECGIRNYLAVYQLGEHGGFPSPDHARNGVRAWHQADTLLGRLSYLPTYARGSLSIYAFYRARAAARAWLRLVRLRFFNPRHIHPETSAGRWRLACFSVLRMLHLH